MNLYLKKNEEKKQIERMSSTCGKIFTGLYAYGFIRSFYYNGQIKNKKGEKILFGSKIQNTYFSTFLSFPFFPIYIYDDLNVFNSRISNQKYDEKIFPFMGKIDNN